VLWVDIDKLLQQQLQQAHCVSSELEAQLVVGIIHRLVEVSSGVMAGGWDQLSLRFWTVRKLLENFFWFDNCHPFGPRRLLFRENLQQN